MEFTSQLPQFPEPFWRDTVQLPQFEKLNGTVDVEAIIVGGGISGLTAAYQLAQQGVKVAVIEANGLLNGTTGHTTAKLSAQHGLIFDEFIQHFGEEKAKLYYQSGIDAVNFVNNLVKSKGIDCDFTREDAYVYTGDDSYINKIEKEVRAYERLGINGGFEQQLKVPVVSKAAIVMREQAQFHPLQYLKELIQGIVDAGGLIFEGTTADRVDDGDTITVKARDGGYIRGKHLLVCSHFPFYDGKGMYYSRMHAERSYLISARVEKEYPGGMYITAEQPTRSLRSVHHNGATLVIFGGHSHRTGQEPDTLQYYEALEAFGRETFGIKEITHRWSAQDLTTLDKLPYIGRIKKDTPNVYVATGYRKWGMTNGTMAGLLLSDLVLGKDNQYEELFNPSRFYADPSIRHFISQNADVAAHLVEGKLEPLLGVPEDVAPGEAAVVRHNGKRAGCYREENGTLHLLDTTCTHMGCEVEWNNGERTWDCPCHGSRFSITGDVIEGPAKKPLKKLS